MSLSLSKLDIIYRSIVITKFFKQGWGDVEKLKSIFRLRKIIANKTQCNMLINKNHPITIGKETESTSTYSVFEGHFESPMVHYLDRFIPNESKMARFQMIVPKKWPNPHIKPMVIHLAGTGDHFFGKRRHIMAKPLVKEAGIGSIILENPFYGYRKPEGQKRSSLRNVSDIFIMGGCLILETIVLFNWLERMGYGPLGVTGISMGGHNAALAGASYDKPVSIIPCLSWTTASPSFTEGVMRESVSWDILESEFDSYDSTTMYELVQMINSPEIKKDELFKAGKAFAKNYPEGITSLTIPSDTELIVDKQEKGKTRKEVAIFMKGVMDEATHLSNFSFPVDPSLAFLITASQDNYVPQAGVIPLTNLWKGCTHVNIPDHGHVSAILFKADLFRKAIRDSFTLNATKYHNCPEWNQKPQEQTRKENE